VETNVQDAEKHGGEFAPREMQFTVEKKYLVFPVQNKTRDEHTVVRLRVGGREARTGSIGLADSPEQADWYVFYTIDEYSGSSAEVTVESATTEGFALVRQSDTIPGEKNFHEEPWRPQFHFTQKIGWSNDPNGMVYHNGTWHLFFQHNPLLHTWGNMTWGHATSKDLVHWEQRPDALHHKVSAKGACFSGGATVDKHNTAGFGENALVAFFTDTEAGESMAYSTDGGETLIPYEDNPVIWHEEHRDPNENSKPGHEGRDPKVSWYTYGENDTPLNDKAKELGGHWVMCVYVYHPDEVLKDDKEHRKGHYGAIYTSTDLKRWELQSKLEGYFECMELFELPVAGEQSNRKWVMFAANAEYAVGSFDGRTFIPEHEGKHRIHYGPFYASQTFDNAPEGRRIQVGWLRIDTPQPPYDQHFSIPYDLALVDTPDGARMRANPIREIEQLRIKTNCAETQELGANKEVRLPVTGDLLDVTAEVEVGDASEIRLELPGRSVVYDADKQTLNDAPLQPVDGVIAIRVLADRLLTETVGNDGEVCISSKGNPAAREGDVTVSAKGGTAALIALEAHQLNSIWRKTR